MKALPHISPKVIWSQVLTTSNLYNEGSSQLLQGGVCGKEEERRNTPSTCRIQNAGIHTVRGLHYNGIHIPSITLSLVEVLEILDVLDKQNSELFPFVLNPYFADSEMFLWFSGRDELEAFSAPKGKKGKSEDDQLGYEFDYPMKMYSPMGPGRSPVPHHAQNGVLNMHDTFPGETRNLLQP
jgi:hypothetical protein